MQFHKLSSPSLKELFITELENMILSGKLPIGSKLPSERELASSMQVSRAVVNAGIKELEKKGFLIVKPRIGIFVEDYRRNGSMETLISIIKYHGGALGEQEVRSILELRMVLNALAAYLTIDNTSDEELASLLPILEEIKSSPDNGTLVENTFRLYHEMAFISKNALLPLIVSSCKDLICPLWLRFVKKYGADTLIQNNETFVNLLLARQREEAIEHAKQSSLDSICGNRPIY